MGKGSGGSRFIARARARVLGGLGVRAVDVTAGTRGGRCGVEGTDAEAGVRGSSTSGGGGGLGRGRGARLPSLGLGSTRAARPSGPARVGLGRRGGRRGRSQGLSARR